MAVNIIPSTARAAVLRAGVFASAIISVPAQPVIGPAPQAVSSSTVAEDHTAGSKPRPKSLFASALPSSMPFLKWGPVSVRPHLLYRILECDGLLNATQLEDSSSLVQTVAPGVLLEVGQNWTVDYTHSRTFYSSRFFHDEVKREGNITGAYVYGHWLFAVAGGYASDSTTLVETARQTPQDSYSTEVTAAYQLGPRIRLSTTAGMSWRDVRESIDNPEWTTADWKSWTATEFVRYLVSPRLDIGVGVTFGYDNIDPGADMSHYQPHAQLVWKATEKITLSLRGGFEERTIKGLESESMTNPIYHTSLSYTPFTTTTISVAATRGFSASYFANRAIRTMGWSATVEQRLLKRLYLHLDYTTSRTRYSITGVGPHLGRDDDVRSVGARLSSRFVENGTLSLIYQQGRNTSSASGYSFDGHQIGAEFTYRF